MKAELAAIVVLCLISVVLMGLLQFLYSQLRNVNERLKTVELELQIVLGHTKVSGRESASTQRNVAEAVATVKDVAKKLAEG